MTPSTLRAAGEALYGTRWQCELARALDVADRTLRRWVAGSHPIPPGVAAQLDELMRAHAAADAAVARQLGPAFAARVVRR